MWSIFDVGYIFSRDEMGGVCFWVNDLSEMQSIKGIQRWITLFNATNNETLKYHIENKASKLND